MVYIWGAAACGYEGVDEGGVAGAEHESCRAVLQQQLLHGVHEHWLTALAAGISIGSSWLLLHEILEQE